MPLIRMEIKGMHCKSCSMLVRDIMEEHEAEVLSIDVDEKKHIGHVEIETASPVQEIIDAIESEGEYTVELL